MIYQKLWQRDACESCICISRCGGDSNAGLFGRGCHTTGVVTEPYSDDDMHPANPGRFASLWDDVKGLDNWEFDSFKTPEIATLPRYITKLENASRRVTYFDQDWVALPLFKILRRIDGVYQPRFQNEGELRSSFKIAPHTKIIAVGVGVDVWLERFWRDHLNGVALPKLSSLGLAAVTAPNFSLFSDTTRFQHLRNHKRMLLACEALSKSGISVIPHLNAHNQKDWDFWTSFLKDHPEITFVCKEFQTGLKSLEKGKQAIENLAIMEQAVGRPIHPILVGGGKLFCFAQANFPDRFTILDSRPFMLAMSRKVLCYSKRGIAIEKPVSTLPGQGIDHLLHETYSNYLVMLEAGAVRKSVEKNDVCQGLLTFSISIPNFTVQPVAPGISRKYSGTTRLIHSSTGLQTSSK